MLLATGASGKTEGGNAEMATSAETTGKTTELDATDDDGKLSGCKFDAGLTARLSIGIDISIADGGVDGWDGCWALLGGVGGES